MMIASIAAKAVTAAFSSAVGFLASPLVPMLGEGGAIAFASGALKTVGLMGLSAAAGHIFQPSVGERGNALDFKADPAAPIRGVMGRMAIGGNEVFKKTWGKTNVYLSMIAALSIGPCQSIDAFTADDSAVNFSGAQSEATGFYAGYMWQTRSMGLPGASALTPPTGVFNGSPALTGWTSNHRLTGMVHAMWTLAVAEDLGKRDQYPNDVPDPKWIGKWMKLYDPRKDSTYPGGSGSHRRDDWSTWEWTANPYLHALAWCRGHYALRASGVLDKTRKIAGIGAPDDAIDIAAFVEGANICDANGWTIAGEWSTSDDKWQVLAAMLQAGGGEPLNRGAQISCMVSTPRASIYTYTGADLVGEATIKALTARRERKNTVIPRYRSEANGWEYVAAGEVTSSVYRDEDRGERRSLEVEYSYVTDAKQAAQLAAYDVANAREGLNAALPSKPHLMGLRAGDAFTVDEPELGLNGQKFVVRRRVVEPQTGVVTLEIRSETDGKHPWALGQDANPPPTPSLTGRDPRYLEPPAPESWDVEIPLPTVDGEQVPTFEVIGENDNGWADFIVVEIGPSDEGPWTVTSEVPPTTKRIPISGVQPGQTYWVRLSYRTASGVYSEGVVYGPYEAPALVASDSISVGGQPASQIVGRLVDAEDLIAVQGGLINDLTIRVSDDEGEFASALILVGEAVNAAEGYATAASGSATTASTAAGQASTFAGQASSSADDASDARDGAVSARNQAITSAQAGRLAAASVLPSDFVNDGATWFSGQGGSPADAIPITAAGQFSFPTVAGGGKVLRCVVAGSFADVSAIGAVVIQAGRTYRIRARVLARTIANAPSARLRFAGLDAGYALVAGVFVEQSLSSVNAWYDLSVETTGDALIAAGAVQVRPWLRFLGADTFELQFMKFEDITQSTAAAISAATSVAEASNASASAAEAAISMVAAAQAGQGPALNRNPTFADWPSGSIPANWQNWTGSAGTHSKQPGSHPGLNVWRMASSSAADFGGQVVAGTPDRASPGGDWIVADLEFTLVAGSLQGSGVYGRARNSGGGTVQNRWFGFATTPDAGGVIRGAGVVGQTYRYRILMDLRNAAADNYLFWLMARSSTFSPVGAVTLDWRRAAFRIATDAEVAAQTVLPGLEAAVAINTGAVVDLETQLGEAFFEVIAAAGGAPAQLAIKAGSGGSLISLAASALILKNVVNGSLVEALKLVGGRATFGAPLYIDFNGTRLILGPGFGSGSDPQDKLLLWFGSDAYDENTANFANSIGGFAIRADLTAPTPSEFTASTGTPSVSGQRVGAGSVTSGAVTITPKNAIGAVTYAWEHISGDNSMTINSPASATTTFTAFVSAGQTKKAVFNWTATDTGSGLFRQGLVSVTLTEGL